MTNNTIVNNNVVASLFSREHEYNLYQKAIRQQRDNNFTADILLMAQLRRDGFQGHEFDDVLFAPTPAEQKLAKAMTDNEDPKLAVLEYFSERCPDLHKELLKKLLA